MRRNLFILVIALLSLVSAAPDTSAMGFDPHSITSLKKLANGDSLTSGNGELVFSDFEVITSGSIRSKLSLYKVVTLDDGFAIVGPFVAADGDVGDMLLSYTVTSSSPITGATLRFNGVAHREGSSASVVETFEEAIDIELFVFATGGGGKDRSESVNLEGFTELRVMKDILVDSADCKGFAAISWISQRFETTAPEPAAMLLLGFALLTVHTVRKLRV